MTSLNFIDSSIIVIYLIITMGVGLIMTRKASQSLDNYYLGGRSLPWYMLGMAGMANWFDLTGTMIITSFLYMLGPKGLFIEFRGGAVLILAFLICYTGKWHRRSGCMTGAEWIAYRFGTGTEAKWMRFFKAFMTVVATDRYARLPDPGHQLCLSACSSPCLPDAGSPQALSHSAHSTP